MNHDAAEKKRAHFVQVAERRTSAVLEKLRVLGNCANPYAYEWSDEDLRRIFSAIRRETDRNELRFEQRRRGAPRFSLRQPLSDEESAGANGQVNAGGAAPRGHSVPSPAAEESRSMNETPLSSSSPRGEDYTTVATERSAAIPDADIQAVAVPGRQRSQVEIRLATVGGWRVLAKDKGHRLGYSLYLLGPDGAVRGRQDSGRGTLRRDAIRLAAAMIRDASTPRDEKQLSFAAN